MNNPVKINLDYDKLITPFGMTTLKDRYMLESEQSPQEALARAAWAFSEGDKDFAQTIYEYAAKQWFMFSTPILSNGGTNRGLPISCYLNYVPDSRNGILDHYTENGWLASMGGGIGGSWSRLRSDGAGTSTGGRSTGVIPFMHVVDSQMLAFSQGTTRRGSYAAYLDISHPEIEEFITMRKPTGGDVHRKCLNLHHGVNLTNFFMEAVCAGKEWELIDPHTKEIVRTIQARDLWQLLLETRVATGEPYIHWIDTTNADIPFSQWEQGLRVHHSNLCTEITLATDENRTAVCCLSSVNLEYFDEWKADRFFIPNLIRFLDNVITVFCETAPQSLQRAVFSASQERSLGLGAMGFHAYLQRKNIPFEGALAHGVNRKIFEHIKRKAKYATTLLAEKKGACPDSSDSPFVRNMHLLAIAPNASSSIICGGTSPSVEPFRANAYTHKTMSGSFLVKNKYLEALLEKMGRNDEDTWKSIIQNRGSVQHLEFLEAWHKQVYRTALEIDQEWVVSHAISRQTYICQAQSINLFFAADENVKKLHKVHMKAWKGGLKTLYYLRSEAVKRAEVVGNTVERKVRPDSDEDCLSCQG